MRTPGQVGLVLVYEQEPLSTAGLLGLVSQDRLVTADGE